MERNGGDGEMIANGNTSQGTCLAGLPMHCTQEVYRFCNNVNLGWQQCLVTLNQNGRCVVTPDDNTTTIYSLGILFGLLIL